VKQQNENKNKEKPKISNITDNFTVNRYSKRTGV